MPISLERLRRVGETLKLKSPLLSKSDPKLEGFMQDFKAGTYTNPFNPRERVLGEDAIIEARPFDGMIHLNLIRSVEKGKGQGSKGLDWLCGLADAHGVAIDLNATPVGTGGLNKAKLVKWYTSRGFKREGEHMVRQPKTAKMAAYFKPWTLIRVLESEDEADDYAEEAEKKYGSGNVRVVKKGWIEFNVMAREASGGVPTLKELDEYMRIQMIPWYSSGESFRDAYYGNCDKVSVWLAAMIDGTKVRGWYMGPIAGMSSVNKAGHHAHSWVEKNGKIYDPTWWAFNGEKPKVYVFNADDPRYTTDEDAESGIEPTKPYNGYETNV